MATKLFDVDGSGVVVSEMFTTPAETYVFYRDSLLAKEAFTQCKWIGSGVGQIDELKETQAAILRIASGLSTYEAEIARLGGDWRENFTQRIRENKVMTDGGLVFDLAAKKPLGQQPGAADDTTAEDDTALQVAA